MPSKKEPLLFVVSIPDLRGSDVDWEGVSAEMIAAYIREAVKSWGGQFETEHPMFPRPMLRREITVQTLNQFMARNIGHYQLA